MYERPPPRNGTPPEVAGDHTEGMRQYKAHTNSAAGTAHNQAGQHCNRITKFGAVALYTRHLVSGEADDPSHAIEVAP